MCKTSRVVLNSQFGLTNKVDVHPFGVHLSADYKSGSYCKKKKSATKKLREIIDVYSENRTDTDVLWGKSAGFFNVKIRWYV
jgi:hypothetical protein